MSGNINKYDEKEYKLYTSKSEYSKALNTLKGIVIGISLDTIILEEIAELRQWMDAHNDFINTSPFSELYPILRRALEDNILTQDEIDDVLWVCDSINEDNPFYQTVTADLQLLHGIIHGVLADNKITELEMTTLKTWLWDNDQLKGTYPYDELISLLVVILKDGIIDEDEQNYLKAFFADFIDTKSSLNLNEFELQELKKQYSISGICAIDPDIEFENKKFCFTGESSRCTRADISETVTKMNGCFKNNVTNDTDYLVIGNNGNTSWAFSCFGRKVEKAINMRKQGHPIQIVHENDFWDVTI